MAPLLALPLTALPAQAVQPRRATLAPALAAPTKAKSITDSGLALFELKEACARSPQQQLCKLSGGKLKEVVEQGQVMSEKLLDDDGIKRLYKDYRKRGKRLKKSEATDLANKVETLGKKNVKSFRTKLGKMKPNKASIGLWAADVAQELSDRDASAFERVESVASVVPIFGDIVSFGGAASRGDIEGVYEATFALGAVAASFACPPLAALITTGLALKALIKSLFAALAGEEGGRNWATEPPGTLEEFYEAGGRVQWEKRGGGAIVAGPKGGTRKLSIVFSSKSDDLVITDQPAVSYVLKPLKIVKMKQMGGKYREAGASEFTVGLQNDNTRAQDQRSLDSVKATGVSVLSGGSTTSGTCKRFRNIAINPTSPTTDFCGPKHQITVRPFHPAVVTMTFDTKGNYCKNSKKPAGCTFSPGRLSLRFMMTPRNGRKLEERVPVTVKG
ncbi:hypothetical protein [Streptomyces sp. UNOC14_S4]|uniref:hypothetical protein n=1 Tax=Streptomyces sp. UNOC14_S4 TaxID=2872340 RepID=UPI001E5E5BEE|nr:hypothetical protein [Streptomyces sp. UNOC14_S4]MCC3767847.1 hypothetical protein [Streptomyces sp. UNOC14_S4]